MNDSKEELVNVVEKIKQEMIEHVAWKDIIPINQQKDEPELNYTQKTEIFNKILEKTPIQFLYRFGQYLLPKHLEYFESNQVDQCYSIKYLVTKLKKQFASSSKTNLRNRRYHALTKFINEGDYFTDSEMKKRNPLMYELLVEKYLTDEELEEIRSERIRETTSLLDVIVKQMEDEYTNDLKQSQKSQFSMEEMDSSDEECEDSSVHSGLEDSNSKEKKKELLKDEFRTMMYSEFLEGNDSEFDYSKIDEIKEIEEDSIENQDNEDKYFDSETPNDISPTNDSEKEEEKEEVEDEDEDELDIYIKSLKTEEEEMKH